MGWFKKARKKIRRGLQKVAKKVSIKNVLKVAKFIPGISTFASVADKVASFIPSSKLNDIRQSVKAVKAPPVNVKPISSHAMVSKAPRFSPTVNTVPTSTSTKGGFDWKKYAPWISGGVGLSVLGVLIFKK